MNTMSFAVLFVLGFIVLGGLTIGTFLIIKKSPEGSSTQYRAFGFAVALVFIWIASIAGTIWFWGNR